MPPAGRIRVRPGLGDRRMVDRGDAGELRVSRRVAAGPSIKDGVHPLSFVDPPPAIEAFAVLTAEFLVRANGWPIVVLSGSCPPLSSLMGWVLVVTVRHRRLAFGGLHPKVRDGLECPFVSFFELSGAGGSVQGMLRAVLHVDVLVVRDNDRPESFIFRYVDWGTLMAPSGREDVYGRVASDSPGGAD